MAYLVRQNGPGDVRKLGAQLLVHLAPRHLHQFSHLHIRVEQFNINKSGLFENQSQLVLHSYNSDTFPLYSHLLLENC